MTGSSNAGATTVKTTFNQIFRREAVRSVSIEGDALHRHDRAAMKAELDRRKLAGDDTFSHFSYDANELGLLEDVFRTCGEIGKGRNRHYVHDNTGAARWGSAPATFTDWQAPSRTART